jgi:murein L,D-transpeptidase YcbB/YkuD
MGFGDITGIIFRIVANLPAIIEAANKIFALYPQLMDVLKGILPGVFGAKVSPAAAGGGKPDGFNVQWLQESLNTLDSARLKIDGDYGNLTREAVKAFQTKHGLFVDGWAGLATSAKIYDMLAKTA